MRILIDGDACPVINIAVNIGKKYDIEVIIFTTINHNMSKYDATVVLAELKHTPSAHAIGVTPTQRLAPHYLRSTGP